MAAAEVFTVGRQDLDGLTNTTTLITGGSAGIGLQTALLIHSLSPTNNIIVLDRQPPSNTVPHSLIHSPRFLFQKCDITSWREQSAAFAAGIARFGAIDHCFVNAGINEYKDQIFTDQYDNEGNLQEPDRRTINIDLDSAVDTVKLAIHYMRRDKSGGKGGSGGNIVLAASMAGYLASQGAPLYSAAKHGIVGLMRALKNDTATLGISISVVAPGITLTDIIAGRNLDESLSHWATRMREHGVAINEPADVAVAVAFLFQGGMKSNGRGLLIQAGRFLDVEAAIARSRSTWMGSEMLQLFRSGRDAPLFPNKLNKL